MPESVNEPAPTAASPTPASAPAAAPAAGAAKPQRSKPKSKPKRKARRRGSSDSESDGNASDSASSNSSASNDDEADKDAVFPDVSSTTPAAWADDVPTNEETLSFDAFNRGDAAARGRGAAVRGRGGRGGKVPRELTEEERKRREEKFQAKKERQKAKRKEAKEAKRKERDAATSSTGDKSSAQAAEAAALLDEVDKSLAASTSAITLDDPDSSSSPAPTPHAPHLQHAPHMPQQALRGRNNRAAYTARVAEDPKFTPRVGNFWMHDQRHYESGNVGEGSFSGLRGMSDYWRGRGGPPRGMPRGGFRGAPRGRGRGFAPFVPPPPPPPREQVPEEQQSNGPRMAEMDKLELELEKSAAERRPRAQQAENKWGHEGFDEINSVEDGFRPNRALRGRGRGRGFIRGGMRGGVPHGPIPHGPIPHPVAHLPTPEASPDRAAKGTEVAATQPAVEGLLDDTAPGAVTVRLPGEKAAAVEARPPSQPVEAAPQSSQPSPFPPAFTPSNPSPQPYVGSDSGSMSSGYVPAAPAPQEYYGMAPNAQFRSPQYYPNFRPQSFTPEPAFPQRGSFSGPPPTFYPGAHPGAPAFTPGRGRASPLNPYGGQMGFFAPPRPQKVSIRSAGAEPKSPMSEEAALSPQQQHQQAHGQGVPNQQQDGFVPAYYGYNPYAQVEQGMYYPQQGYWQGGYEQGAYYDGGEYQGY